MSLWRQLHRSVYSLALCSSHALLELGFLYFEKPSFAGAKLREGEKCGTARQQPRL